MRVSDFSFDLPADRIADFPAEPRDRARLLVHDRRTRQTEHATFRELPRWLRPEDLLVVNNTRVMPHRLFGRRETGGKVEVLILERSGAACRGYVKPARKVRPGDRIPLEDGRLVLVAGPLASSPVPGVGDAAGAGILEFELRLADHVDVLPDDATITRILMEVGRAPLPPYIARDGSEDREQDLERYQTVFATEPGAVAAPTAGMHFTDELLAAIRSLGVRIAEVTLHVGPGTFAPVRVTEVEDHVMHSEHFELGPDVAAAVAETRLRRGRVIAVGTTATRTLEACSVGHGAVGDGAVDEGAVGDDRHVAAATGSTDLFLYPGSERGFRVVDALITNFHLPESTLLMLVAAFAGREQILEVYAEAIELGYRFYSFGDGMMLL